VKSVFDLGDVFDFPFCSGLLNGSSSRDFDSLRDRTVVARFDSKFRAISLWKIDRENSRERSATKSRSRVDISELLSIEFEIPTI